MRWLLWHQPPLWTCGGSVGVHVNTGQLGLDEMLQGKQTDLRLLHEDAVHGLTSEVADVIHGAIVPALGFV
eukprot:9854-Eustigmatos_ZCMA.PRE.1